MSKEFVVMGSLGEPTKLSDKICPIHNINMRQTTNKIRARDNRDPHYSYSCPKCFEENKAKQLGELVENEVLNAELVRSYGILESKSIIPPKLKEASYKTLTVSNDIDQQAKNFGLYLNEYYFKHGGTGNAILQGLHGVGKSHLTISIARKLNEDFKAINEPKSVLFMPSANLFREMESGQDYNANKRRQGEMMKLLTSVDFLFLDDLGKETTFGNHSKEATNERQRFLFELLDSRTRTIINTNLTGKQLKSTYDPAIVSRIMEGVGKNLFVYPDTAEDKRKLPF